MGQETRLNSDKTCKSPVARSLFVVHSPRIKKPANLTLLMLNATRRHGGKIWMAPNVMVWEDVSAIMLLACIPLRTFR